MLASSSRFLLGAVTLHALVSLCTPPWVLKYLFFPACPPSSFTFASMNYTLYMALAAFIVVVLKAPPAAALPSRSRIRRIPEQAQSTSMSTTTIVGIVFCARKHRSPRRLTLKADRSRQPLWPSTPQSPSRS